MQKQPTISVFVYAINMLFMLLRVDGNEGVDRLADICL